MPPKKGTKRRRNEDKEPDHKDVANKMEKLFDSLDTKARAEVSKMWSRVSLGSLYHSGHTKLNSVPMNCTASLLQQLGLNMRGTSTQSA